MTPVNTDQLTQFFQIKQLSNTLANHNNNRSLFTLPYWFYFFEPLCVIQFETVFEIIQV